MTQPARAPRFFVDATLAAGGVLPLPESVAHHAVRVLRLEDGAPIRLFNGRGGEYGARLAIAKSGARALIESFDAVERESPLAITLIQSMASADKLDWVIEKATELGAARIALVATARSVARATGERLQRKLEHWRDVAIAACNQCGRNRVPHIEAAASLAEALAPVRDAQLKLVLAVDASERWPMAITGPVAIVVGPEGGFTDEELALAHTHAFHAVRLGPRTLRTETAGLAAIAALQAIAGDLD
jgi:16S rRNA (uracil1498-N3)-methyltransferase